MSRNKKTWKYIRLLLIEICFLVISLYTGPVVSEDSMEYVIGSPFRAGLYPVFLSLFNAADNLLIPIIIQNLLTAFSIWLISEYISTKDIIVLKKENSKISLVICYLSILSTYIFTCIGINYWIPSAILTEGICYPLYYISLYFILVFVDSKKKRYFITAFFFSLLCVLVRSQMMVFTVSTMAIGFFLSKISIKRVLVYIAGILFIFVSVKGFENIYDNINNFNKVIVSPIDTIFAIDFVFLGQEDAVYSMNEDEKVLYDLAYLSNKEIGYLYNDIAEDFQGMGIEYKREELFNPAWIWLHHKSEYSNYLEYIGNKYNLNYDDSVKKTRNLIYSMSIKVCLNNSPLFLKTYSLRVSHALARMVLPCPRIFTQKLLLTCLYFVASFLFYILYIVAMIKSKNKYFFWASFYISVSAVMNVIIVSLFHAVEPRYFAYNTGLIYLSMLINIYLIYMRKKEVHNE